MMINWNRVIELRDEIGADDFAEIVDVFVDEVDEKIDQLRDGIAPEELEGVLHFLKGSALSLGFADLAALCAGGEKNAAKGAFDVIDLDAICACHDSSRQVFLGELPTRLAA